MLKLLIPAGGLGNQLFTWNAAHYLAKNSKSKVFVVYPKENKLGERSNILGLLSEYCEHRIAIINSDLVYKFVKLRDRIHSRIPKISWIVDSLLLLSKEDNPEEIIRHVKRFKILYVGYFQNSDFVIGNFADYFSELSALEIAVREGLSDKNDIHQSQVGIHIRRGDFVQNAATIGILSSSYFTPVDKDNCLITCENEGDLPSDWAGNRIISGETYSEWESFFLLSYCDEIWISNSTFSWWAGLYGNHAHGSRVIAPEPWNKTNLYSEEYLKIESWHYRTSKFDEL